MSSGWRMGQQSEWVSPAGPPQRIRGRGPHATNQIVHAFRRGFISCELEEAYRPRQLIWGGASVRIVAIGAEPPARVTSAGQSHTPDAPNAHENFIGQE